MEIPSTISEASAATVSPTALDKDSLLNFLEQAPAGIAMLQGPEHRYSFANSLYQKIFKRSATDLIGNTVREVFPEIEGQGIYELFDTVYNTGQPFVTHQFAATFNDGEKVRTGYYNFVIQPIIDSEGAVTNLMVQAYEVTQQEEALQQKQESEAKYRGLFNSLDQGFCVVQLIRNGKGEAVDYRFLEVNPVFTVQSGLQDPLGKTALELVPNLEKYWFDLYSEVAATGNSKRFVQVSEAMGRWFEVFAYRVENAEADQVAILFTDVTEKKKAERALLDNRQLLETVFDASSNALSVLEIVRNESVVKDFRFLMANNLTRQAAGSKDLGGKLYSEVFPSSRNNGLLQRMIDTADGDRTVEWEVLEENGNNKKWLRFLISRVSVMLVVSAEDITARKSGEEALRKSENRYRSIFETASVSIWEEDFTEVKKAIDRKKDEGITDFKTYFDEHPDFINHCLSLIKVTDVNNASLRMFEADSKEQLLQNLSCVFLPETIEVFKGELIAIAEERTDFASECLMQTVKGKPLYCLFSMRLPQPGQPFDRVLFTLLDITERKRAETELMQSEARFRNVLDQTPEPFVVLKGPELRVEIANEPLLRTWRKDESVIGKPLIECLPELKGQGVIEMMLDVFHNKKIIKGYDRPVIYDRGNGVTETLYYNFIHSPYLEASGEVSGVMVIGTDVTSSVLARQALEESEGRFRTLATTIPQIVWTTDEGGKINYLNDQWEAYTGQPASEGLLQNYLMLHPDDVNAIAESWTDAVKKGIDWKMDYRIWHKPSGQYRWFTGLTAPLKDNEGKIIRWIGTSTDIHEQKIFTEQLEALVAERTRELQRSNEDLQQFAHVASHDLKEPVRKVKTFLSRLEQHLGSDLDETSRRFMERMHSATNRMFTMIDGVLRYSTINAAVEAFQTVDLNEVMKNIETDLEVIIQSTGTTIEYNNLPQVEGAPVLLYQVFYNLVNNSIKFAREGVPPRIRLEAQILVQDNRRFAKILFSDNGIGFEDEQAAAIFDTFTRLHPKDQYEGTGLGLALCKKIVERHGGTISAHGEDGQGATFTILLPSGDSVK